MLTIASVFAILLLVGLTSAAMSIVGLTYNPTAAHNTDLTVSFKLTNDGTANVTNATLTFSPSGDWISTPDSQTVFNIFLEPGENSSILTATLHIPEYQYNSYTATIGGDYNYSSGIHKTISPQTITINVPADPKLEITGGTISTGENDTTITVKNTGNVPLSGTLASSGNVATTLSASTFSLAAGQNTTVTVSADGYDLEDLVGSQTISTITANVTSGTYTGTHTTGAVKYEGEFCEYGVLNSDLKIDLEITDVEGLGDEDDANFLPLDTVTFEVSVENNGDSDIQDIELEWGVYNTKTGEWFIEPDEEDKFDLDSDDDTTIEVTFDIDEIKDLNGEDYALYVRATGEIDDSDNANDGEKVCVSESEDMNIIQEKDLLVVRNIEMPTDLFCGQDVELTAELWNIGEKDQEDVTVRFKNEEFGLDEEYTFDKIKSNKKEDLTLQFTVPADADPDKIHYIVIEVRDEDDDLYEYDDNTLSYLPSLKISGGCMVVPDVTITPSLVSERAVAGGEVIISAIIENTGTTQKTFTIGVDGLDSWATLNEIDKTTLLIPAGQSQTVQIKLTPNEGIEGTETFNINTVASDGSSYSQPVSVSVENDGFSFGSGLSGVFEGNSLYWIIGAINVILIIAIIVVVVRILSNKN